MNSSGWSSASPRPALVGGAVASAESPEVGGVLEKAAVWETRSDSPPTRPLAAAGCARC